MDDKQKSMLSLLVTVGGLAGAFLAYKHYGWKGVAVETVTAIAVHYAVNNVL